MTTSYIVQSQDICAAKLSQYEAVVCKIRIRACRLVPDVMPAASVHVMPMGTNRLLDRLLDQCHLLSDQDVW